MVQLGERRIRIAEISGSNPLGSTTFLFMIKLLILRFSLTLFVLSFASFSFASDVKSPNVAGSFYPADPTQLSQQIESYLEKAGPQAASADNIRALICPHAGYEYSGPVAAYGYRAIQGKSYDTVVIIAPSHHLDFDGVAIWPKGAFKTPLGEVAVDEELCAKLKDLDPSVKDMPQAFDQEHAVEVQLPFLQKILKNFKIVPLIMGRFALSDCEFLGHSLALLSKDKNTLLVVSTDLSHYYPYEQANRMDKATIFYIETLNAEGLYQQARQGICEACGLGGVLSSIFYAKELGLESKVLKIANSGDTTFDYSKVVGYGSVAMYKPVSTSVASGEGEKNMLNEKQRERLLEIARQSIETYVKTGKRLEVKESDPVLNAQCGAFVSLHEKGELRGCIGNMVGRQPLYLTIRDMAVEAGVNDPRFSSLKSSELKDIKIEISVLSPLKKASSADEIKMGVHGVMVCRGLNSGVFLPQVATETGWSKEEFLGNLCLQKAGLPADAWKDKKTDLYTFTAEVFSEKK